MSDQEINIYATQIETLPLESGSIALVLTVYKDDLEFLLWSSQLPGAKDLVNNALTLLNWIVEEVKEGHVIASVDEEAQEATPAGFAFLKNIRPTLIN
jgi:hypothetical protein